MFNTVPGYLSYPRYYISGPNLIKLEKSSNAKADTVLRNLTNGLCTT